MITLRIAASTKISKKKKLTLPLLAVLIGVACGVDRRGAEPVHRAEVGVPQVQIQSGTVCAAFVSRVELLAKRHSTNVAGFLAALQSEFVGGSGDPFAMRDALRAGRWNQRYVYAGHGGFRAEYDDDRKAYRSGGNHQPGHFVSVLSVAAQFGKDAARVAIGEAGDYNAREEDDLRLSEVAIPLGTGLAAGSVRPRDVATRTRMLCR